MDIWRANRIAADMQDTQSLTSTFDFRNANRTATGSMKWMKYPPDILPMWVADMDFKAADPIIAALQARVEHGVFGYTLPTPTLLATCQDYFARRWNWHIEPDWLVVSPGLSVAIHTVSRYLRDPSQGLLVPQPIYHVFRNALSQGRRQRIDVPMVADGTGWTLDPDALKHAADAAGGASVLMLCNPHNPNGKVFTRAELEILAELSLREKWLICSDEVHADLILDDGLEHIPIASLSPEVAKICLTMQSPSKAFNVAGLNFAVLVIADPELRKQYQLGAYGQVISQLNPLGMVAAQAAWSGQCDAWLAVCIRQLRANRDQLLHDVATITGVHMNPLPATFLAWLNVSELGLTDPHAHFAKHGLGLSAGQDFGDTDYLRLNFGCDQETLQLGIDRLREGAAAASAT